MKKICFITISPLTEWDNKRFGINEIMNSGAKVLVLDCTPFLYRKFDRFICGKDLSIKKTYVKRCNSLFEFIKLFTEFRPQWTIYFLPLNDRRKFFHRLLIRIIIKINSKIIHYRLGTIPIYQNKLKNNTIKTIILYKSKKLLSKIIFSPWQILSADKVVIGGNLEYFKIKDKSKVIAAHNHDYDEFLKVSKKITNQNYKSSSLLFLDEQFPMHTDYFREDVNPEVKKDDYFKEISDCLDKLGKNLSLKPLIKLHPRANNNKISELYTLQTEEADTANLIHKSDLVVAHCSTAIQLAVLFYKPILLLIPNQLRNNSFYKLTIDNFKKELGATSVRVKNISNIKTIPKVNRKKYDEYKERFIKMNSSEEKFSWEIILENL